MKVTLTVTEGPHQGREFAFCEHDSFIVGRSKDAHFRLSLKDRYFSRHHFLVEINPPRCRLVDMASTNGTFVNGHRVEAVDLRDGDVIRGGATSITVTVEPDESLSDMEGDASGETPIPASDQSQPAGPPTIPGYRLERELGRGGMGVVYLARSEPGGHAVALKTILPAASGSSETVARFLREASVLRRLEHPNIVRFHQIGRSGDRLFFAMEYVEGPNAFALAGRQGGALSVGLACGLAAQVLDALTYAHAAGFVHRDIKPQNLLVGSSRGQPIGKLADFGLARLYLNSPLSGLTLTGQVAGTFGFMAPEQVTDFRGARPASDLYAVGATLYYLLTGRRPYDFPPQAQLQLLMLLQEEPVPIRTRRPDLPPALAAVIQRSLARSPAERFPDARVMCEALMAAVRG